MVGGDNHSGTSTKFMFNTMCLYDCITVMRVVLCVSRNGCDGGFIVVGGGRTRGESHREAMSHQVAELPELEEPGRERVDSGR